MTNFFDKTERLSLEERIALLDNVISGLCDRFDKFETILMNIKESVESGNNLQSVLQQESEVTDNDREIEPETLPAQVKYCGQPAGCGFEVVNITEEKGVRSLYVMELIEENTAYFYPLTEKTLRFKNDLMSLFTPVCDVDKDLLDSNSFEVERQNYGMLTLENGNYWKVTKKCLITCIK